MAKHLYVIAGPNGAGKTTFANEFLPKFANCKEFVNADSIAAGLAPYSPRSAALQAGRLMLKKIDELATKGTSFGFETTLSGRKYLSRFQKLRESGYKIHLYFLWLPSVDLAIQRVRDRIKLGGHSVPESDIRRRFDRGLALLLDYYLPLTDDWVIFDNSGKSPNEIAFGTYRESSGEFKVHDEVSFAQLLRRKSR